MHNMHTRVGRFYTRTVCVLIDIASWQ